MLKVKKFYPDAQLPRVSFPMDAGYDLYSYVDIMIPPHETVIVETGIGIAVPSGTYGRIAPRSGVSLKKIMINAGVADQSYRGMIKVIMHNMGNEEYHVSKGDRIAQLVLEKIEKPDIEEVEELDETDRGDKGFGSSGR